MINRGVSKPIRLAPPGVATRGDLLWLAERLKAIFATPLG
jgi:hypothetical protein